MIDTSEVPAIVALVRITRPAHAFVRRGLLLSCLGFECIVVAHLRRALVDAAWQYRHPPRIMQRQKKMMKEWPAPVSDTAWRPHRAKRGRMCCAHSEAALNAIHQIENDGLPGEANAAGCSTELLALAGARSRCSLDPVTAKSLFRWRATNFDGFAPSSSTENDRDSVQHRSTLCSRKGAHAFNQLHAIDLGDLGHIRDRVLRQTGRFCGEGDVSGKPCQAEIRGQGHDDDGGDLAQIERVGLDDDDWSNETRLRADWFSEVCPANISLRNYHSVSRTRRRLCADSIGSASCPASEMASLMAAVTSLSVWRARYSDKARL